MNKNDLAFSRINYLLLAVCAVVIIVGFVLMSGPGTTADEYNADIFSPLRIKVAPIVTFIGFVGIIAAVMVKPRHKKEA